jgi:hypothetical protein
MSNQVSLMSNPVRPEPAGHPHQHAAAADNPLLDNLLLDIGGDIGALIIHTAAHRDQTEIEISACGAGRPRTHNVVRRRQAAGGARYAAVFPDVPAGDYVVWRDDGTPAGTVTVRGGAVACFRFDQG